MAKRVDENAPACLLVKIVDPHTGESWGNTIAPVATFSSGSEGFRITTKIVNPADPTCRYQVNGTIVLIGSKEERKDE